MKKGSGTLFVITHQAGPGVAQSLWVRPIQDASVLPRGRQVVRAWRGSACDGGLPRHREMRAFVSCMAYRSISRPLSKRLRRLDSFSPPSELQEITVATREQSGVLCFHSR